MKTEAKQKCFVIMPFAQSSDRHTEEYWTKHFETFLKPLIEEKHPLIAERSAALRGDIVRQIITDLVTAPVVIADITDINPNVYWELGVRQSFKHCTVTIAEKGTRIPFDLGAKGTLFYFPDDHIKMRGFIRQFEEALNDCLLNPKSPDSHVLETISGRGTIHQIIMREEVLRKLDALLSEAKRNRRVLDETIKFCNENAEKEAQAKKEGKKNVGRNYLTERIGCVAAQMLSVDRYLDCDKEFYDLVEKYMNFSVTFNDQLAAWESNPSTTEAWFFKAKVVFEPMQKEFEQAIKAQKKSVESIY